MHKRPCPIRRVSPADEQHYWFGYYDTSPWPDDESVLLCHRASFCDRFPRAGEPAEIGLIEDWNTPSPRFVPLATTHAWNWQQGAKARWSRFASTHQHLLFNDLAPDGSLCTRMLDRSGREIGRLPFASYEDAGSCLISLSFGRLSRLRPEYGYPALADQRAAVPAPDDDGIFRIDPDGSTRLIVSIAALDSMSTDNGLPAGGSLHQHVNHIMINPSGTRFCFMHRFERDDGILHSRLFTSDLEGRDVRLLFEGMCSHYDWRDDHTILAWAGKRSLLGGPSTTKSPSQRVMTVARRGLKPVYYALGKPRFLMNRVMKDSYLLIADVDMRTPEAPTPQTFAKGELTCDGHCTFSRCANDPGRWVLTDGYPDLKSRQPLFLWDTRQNIGHEIGRFATPRALDGEIRVDLHPRFNHDATKVCIDSAMDGSRAMYVVDVRSITAP